MGLHAFSFRSGMHPKNYVLRALCTLTPFQQLACDFPRGLMSLANASTYLLRTYTRCQPDEAASGFVDL